MSNVEILCLNCPKKKWICFALESQGNEPPVNPMKNGWHEYGPAPAKRGRTSLPLIKNVVWLDQSVDLNETMQGKPLTHVSEALAVTVHFSEELSYLDFLPRQDSTK